MAAPTEPQPEVETTDAPSARSDRDETVAASSGAPTAPGFGPPTAAGEIGTLGPYRIVKELGRGGMGAVYAAVDTRLERRVALKVMVPEFAADREAKERFLREARAAAKISHDNVVIVHEADERAGVPYIAMQFLEGYPLDRYLKTKGSPTVSQIIRIASETASGLAAAHKIGLVHRDVKPGNLWLEAPHGRVKVLDFGLAKPVDAEVELTKSGAVVGTPAYMSPEQARGEKVDHRTDLFSLGSVLYRLCAGRLPFQGGTTMAVLMALGTEEPTPVRELNPNVPEPLAALIHQLLSKRADARPLSAAEVVKRLRAIAEELTAPRARPVEQSTSQPQLMQPQVVYAVMPVTAAEANPFADLDVPDAEPLSSQRNEPPATAPMPGREKSGRRWLWPAAGFAALLALVAGVIIIIKNKDGTETKIEVPDGATITVKDKDGKTLAQVGPGTKGTPTGTDADRKAAEWVIGLGGYVRVNSEAKDRKAAPDLPKERFTLTSVILNSKVVPDEGLAQLKELKGLTTLSLNSSKVSDAGLAHLKGLKSLTQLGLAGAQVSDAGVEHLKELKELTHLVLSNTQVSDAGVERLKGFQRLTYLGVDSTQVSDAGVAHLKELKALTYLNVQKTGLTAKGLEALRAALPGCQIVHDGGIIQPIDVDRRAAEWVVAQGGFVRANGQEKDIRTAAELPKEAFALTAANLNGSRADDAGLAQLKGLASLATLTLVGTQVTGPGLSNLRDSKGLTELNLSNTPVTDAGLAALKELKRVGSLNLAGTKITDAALAHLKDVSGLTYLTLQETGVTDAGLAHLEKVAGLHAVNLRKTRVTAKGLEALHAARPTCKIEHDGGVVEPTDVDRTAAEWVLAQGGAVRVNGTEKDVKATELPQERFALTLVNLANTKVTDAGLEHLKGNKALTTLYLGGTKVTDAGLVHLGGLKNLVNLALSATPVSDAGLEHLKELKGLTHLGLSNTRVSGAGLAHLRELTSLKALTLSHTLVSDGALEHLKELKSLTLLDLRYTKVTAKGLEALRAALPGCRIEHDGGVIEPKR